MVPLKTDEDGNQSDPPNAQNPFMRGILNFDDYNYKQFNSYVMVKEPESI